MAGVAEAGAAEAPPNQGHRLLRDVLIYGAGGVGVQLLLALTVPITTRIFSTDEYGVIETTTTFLLVLALLATLGLDSASQRSYFDYTDADGAGRRAVLSTTFWVLLATSSLLAAVVVALHRELAGLFFGNERYAVPLALATAALPLTILASFFLEILRMRRQPGRYSLVALFAGVASVTIALILAGALEHGLSGYYLGLLLGGVLACCAGFVLVRGALGRIFDRRELRTMLTYGLPLVPVAASTWVLQFVDRFFVLHYTSLAQLGIYGIGVRIANLLLLAVTAFSLAWSPFMLELHRRDPAAERAARGQVLTVLLAGLAFGAVIISIYANELLRILTPPQFHPAYEVVGLLAGSVVAVAANSVTMTEISLQRRTLFFARYAGYAAALNIALNFLLIPAWGIIGAALATFLTYAALGALYYCRAQRIGPAPFDLSAVLRIVAVAAVLIAVGTFIHPNPVWFSILVKIPLVVAYPLLLRAFGVLRPGWVALTVAWLRGFIGQGILGRPA
jgi:O-antigen/teichoic acid export membrane protein